MTDLKDIVFETDHYWVKRVPKGFEVYKTGLTHSTRVAVIGYTGDKGLQRAKLEIERREAASGPSDRHHSTKKKSPAQLDREIAEVLSQDPSMTTEQIERYRSGRKWGWPADLAFKVATGRPLSRTPGRRSHATLKDIASKGYYAPKPSMTVREINAIVRAADGRNIYLIRTRLDFETVQRITRARTKGRETEVRSLNTGNWIPVLPERGDRLEVR